VRLVFKDFPLASHAQAPLAHAAGRCAAAVGQFWPYHDRLFSVQPAFEREELIRYALDLSLDAATFTSCLDGADTRRGVDADVAEGRAIGIRGTPSFLINGSLVVGAVSIEQFREAIDEALRRGSLPRP
jgi:protein-disulfide isomerase